MDNWFQSKWFVRAISLVLALSLYFFVTIEPNIQKEDTSILPGIAKEVQVMEDIPLNVKINSDEYVVSGVPEYVTVSLEGKASVLAPVVRQKNFTTHIDLRELEAGEHLVAIEHENIPDDIAVYIEPKSIEVTIEKRASKEFSVEVDFVNLDKLPADYEIGEVEVDPELITIVSSESVIDRVAMVKVYIDVTDLRESIRNREVPISVSDINGNSLNVRVEPASAVVSVQVERPSKKVPLKVVTKGELPKGFTLKEIKGPEEIDLYGKRAILNETSEVATKEIDLSKISESGEIEVGLVIPDGIAVNEENVKVKVTLEETKEFDEIGINIVGETDKAVEITSPENGKIDIIAIGSDTVMSKLKASDIKVSVDVSNLAVGQHQVALNITGPEKVKLDAAFEKVTVVIDE